MNAVLNDFWANAKAIATQSLLHSDVTYERLLLEWRREHPKASEADALVAASRLRRICGGLKNKTRRVQSRAFNRCVSSNS